MTVPYRLTPKAMDGFLRIASYVDERFGIEVAERVITDLERAFDQLAKSPGIGHRRTDLTRDERILFWPVGPTLVAYRSSPECLEILFVERGDLDWERMLTDRLEQRSDRRLP